MCPHREMMVKEHSKYYPLYTALQRSAQDEMRLGLAEIEALLGQFLPPSALRRRDWWSNRQGALQAAAWMEAGYVVEEVDLQTQQVVFRKRQRYYVVQRDGGLVIWDGKLVKGLREHMGASQAQFADHLGVRQQTVSEWENGIYAPSRATCKYLSLVAEQAGFRYETQTRD